MQENSIDWEKENIRLAEGEAANREFLRVQTESASDSEVLRQSLRNVEQLVDDHEHHRKFMIRRPTGELIHVVPSMFVDPPIISGSMLRRSMILHKRSRGRINSLRARLGLEDISSVARFALRFSFRIVKEATAGAQFLIVDENGKSKEVRFGSISGSQANAREPVTDGPRTEDVITPPVAGGVLVSAPDPQQVSTAIRRRRVRV
jgi:hypothetical protein